ncbi:MAG: hypothetical protein HGB11_11905 [Chlorobiales bacterium]|nr:hypothetical protein [Chlorobiales bacterium]
MDVSLTRTEWLNMTKYVFIILTLSYQRKDPCLCVGETHASLILNGFDFNLF